LTDEQIVERVRSGQTAAFEVLVKRYETRLFNYLRRMTGNASDAEDLFQETFLRVYTHLDQFRTDGLFRPWVYRIATNVCRNQQRWWRRRPRHVFSEYGEDDAPDPAAANPRELAISAELAERLASAVNRLPVRHRAVFLMARYEGMSYEEIGNALGIPVGTVKSRMNKAVNTLMCEIEEVER
jgi:RNA polymerase sigma-70 factor (ECF subfamily)